MTSSHDRGLAVKEEVKRETKQLERKWITRPKTRWSSLDCSNAWDKPYNDERYRGIEGYVKKTLKIPLGK